MIEDPHLAMADAARAVERRLKESFFGLDGEAGVLPDTESAEARAACTDPAANAAIVKEAARTLGADLVGICRLDPKWRFEGYKGRGSVDLPEGISNVVAMVVAMDAAAITASPAAPARAATLAGYLRMAVCSSALSVFIRRLGYRAIASGNDTALSVPLAVAAGLGEMGLSRMLITPEFGPCVRICKVFTNIPLAADVPVDLGVCRTCESCRRCVRECPGGALGDDWPSPDRPGIDGEACRAYWEVTGSGCSSCIAMCPFMPKTS